MNAKIQWQKGMSFETQIRSHRFLLDTKLDQGGQDLGPSPKELLLTAVIGCAGMDVVSLLTKMRSGFETCEVEASAETRETHPRIFPRIDVVFRVAGPGLKPEPVQKAVKMSLTKYCGVSAMINSTSPIYYQIFVNENLIESGEADFSAENGPQT